MVALTVTSYNAASMHLEFYFEGVCSAVFVWFSQAVVDSIVCSGCVRHAQADNVCLVHELSVCLMRQVNNFCGKVGFKDLGRALACDKF